MPCRACTLLTAGLALALAAAAAASGSGGTAISGAPTIQPGAQQSADTLTDRTTTVNPGSGGCWTDLEFWRLPLSAGDAVEIDATQISPSTNLQVGVFPAGTTDANFASAQAVASGFAVKGPIKFTAPATGTYPVIAGPNCYDGDDGPLTLVVKVSHGAGAGKAVVTLQKVSKLAPGGSLTATVRTAAGAPISDPSLTLELYGSWKDAGSAAASSHLLAKASPKNGSVRFTFHLPAKLSGTAVQLHVTGAGSGYQVSSAAETVSIS
jgi:hypothetical protein